MKATIQRASGATEEVTFELSALAVEPPLDLTADLGTKAEAADVPKKNRATR